MRLYHKVRRGHVFSISVSKISTGDDSHGTEGCLGQDQGCGVKSVL